VQKTTIISIDLDDNASELDDSLDENLKSLICSSNRYQNERQDLNNHIRS
jgi:hypothetical protein